MVIRPTGINHLREVSSWGPTYPPPIPPPPAFLHLNATLLHLSLFALPPFSLSSVTLWNIGTRSSKWILYQLSSSSPLFFRVIVARSLYVVWTLLGCKNETKGLYDCSQWTLTNGVLVEFRTIEIFLSFRPVGIPLFAIRRRSLMLKTMILKNNSITRVRCKPIPWMWYSKFVFGWGKSERRVSRSWGVLN